MLVQWLDLVKGEEKTRPLDECKRMSKEIEKVVDESTKLVVKMEEDKITATQNAT